jgi:HEAT repeat protein
VVDLLTRSVTDESPRVRQAAAWALGETRNPAAVAPILGALEDSEASVREAGAWALKTTADPSAAAPLRKALADEDPKVRAAAAFAVEQFVGPATAESLLPLLQDKAPEVREAATWSLGKSNDPRTVEPLLRCLGDTSAGVRAAAASSLGWISDPRAPMALVDAMADPGARVRAAAAASLGRLDEPLGRLLLDRSRGERLVLNDPIGSGGPSATPASLQALKSRHAVVRRVAAWYLGETGEVRATEGLMAMATSWSPGDRIAGMANLAKLRRNDFRRALSSVARILVAPSSLAYFLLLTVGLTLLISLLPGPARVLPAHSRVGAGGLVAGALLSLPALSMSWTCLLLVLGCAVASLVLAASTAAVTRLRGSSLGAEAG